MARLDTIVWIARRISLAETVRSRASGMLLAAGTVVAVRMARVSVIVSMAEHLAMCA
jgi:hypothetical protein